MKPARFAYHDPDHLAEALALLARLENARVLAGGQSLMPMLAMRVAMPDHLIDLNRIPGLDGIVVAEGSLRIGAMARQRRIEDSPAIRAACPLMTEALGLVGHIQTRNRGTIGGSLCHLDPSAELVTVAAALDATIEVASATGTRDIGIADFPLGLMTPSLAAEEMVVGLRIPLWPAGHGACFTEFARRHGDYAIVSAAALLLPDAQGRIARVSLTLGGVSAGPLRLAAAEAMLLGEAPSPALFRAAASCCAGIDAMEDPQAPAWYRRRLATVLVRRALEQAWARTEGVAA
ncbi:FAD binding domain-containing protein [Falsiroseomonas selenitidurans]|uniref:Xanthine dehydrogenase family protein subunit M n=1 Tax=Falsiroseomonas selenitidurans TaxID=2716335 RepID=A0ABX1E8G8_9PROT|nr:FAD binding domain-containing protein [Falsiroseomonas selenitidurans]NKC33515.1 xanthine dehydrogenase family protein subunit M [Falsiroseomonas selenitidurans]